MKKNIKLLTIIETLGKGGAEQVLVNTLPELQKLGVYCEVVILFDQDDLVDELESFGIKVHNMNLSYKWNILEGLRKLNKLYKANDYDIVHAHLFFAHFYTALSLLFSKKIKKIVTFHNLAFNSYPANTFVKKIRKKIEEILVKTFDEKTAVSRSVKNHYEKHLHLTNINVVYNSFPINDFKKYKIKKVQNKSFNVLTPGRLVREKGHQYLLEAVKILNEKKLNIDFFIVGNGPLEDEVKKVIPLFNNVSYRKALPHNELMKLYRNMDLIVIPSVNEAFGLVVGEAMIMEIPIVATKVDGIIEMIENGKEGLLVEPKSAKSLAYAIEKMINDENLRKSCVYHAKEKIKEFDTHDIAKQWIEIYLKL